VLESSRELLPYPLLQNRACDFHRTRLLNDLALVMSTFTLERVVIPVFLTDISISRSLRIVAMAV